MAWGRVVLAAAVVFGSSAAGAAHASSSSVERAVAQPQVTAGSVARAAAAAPLFKLTKAKLANGRTVVVRWNPCQTTTYKINVAAVPAESRAAVLAEIRASVTKLSKATRIPYSYKGTTAEVPRSSNINTQSAEVIIAVTTPNRTDLGIGGKVLGYGGYHYWEWQYRRASGSIGAGAAIGRGWVVIDLKGLMALRPGFGAGPYRTNVMMHELGHSVGLDHVSNPAELMYPTLIPSGPKGYAAGDLKGLAAVGRSAGCIAVAPGAFKDLR